MVRTYVVLGRRIDLIELTSKLRQNRQVALCFTGWCWGMGRHRQTKV